MDEEVRRVYSRVKNMTLSQIFELQLLLDDLMEDEVETEWLERERAWEESEWEERMRAEDPNT